MKRRFSGALMLLLSAFSAGAFDDGDWQFWNTDSVEYKVNEQFTMKAEVELYFGDDMSELYYVHVQPVLAMQVSECAEIAALYRVVQEKKKGEWAEEQRPAAEATLRGKVQGFKISDRNRFEYRMREGADDFWRYRNRIKMEAPWKWTAWQVQLYVADEFFIDFDAREVNQNRIIGGVSAKVTKELKAELYYMHKTDRKNGEWNATHVLGLALKLGF